MNDTTISPDAGSIEEATQSLLGEPKQDNQQNEIVDEGTTDTVPQESIETQEDNTTTPEEIAPVENTETAPIEPETYDVKVNGEMQKWTLNQLKQSASGQEYIKQELRKTAELKKQAQETYANLQKEREQLASALDQYQNQLKNTDIQKPDISLAETDPIEWSIQNAKWQDAQQQKMALSQQRQKLAKEKQEQDAIALKSYLAQEAETLKKAIPEFANQDTANSMRGKLVDAGAMYGFTDEEISQIIDSRAIRVLNDARKWQELQSNGKVESKVSKARPLNIKPGAKQVASSGKAKAIKDATAKLQQTGSVDDAANWLLATS